MAEFKGEDLTGSRFDGVDLRGALFRDSDLRDARFRAVALSGVRMTGVEFTEIDIYGELRNVRINGVDVVPLVEAELDRRHPDRRRMRPTTPAGFREAWDVVERLW